MSDVASTVKEIIVEKLGVKESEVTPEANFTNEITTVGEAIAHIEKAIAEKENK